MMKRSHIWFTLDKDVRAPPLWVLSGFPFCYEDVRATPLNICVEQMPRRMKSGLETREEGLEGIWNFKMDRGFKRISL